MTTVYYNFPEISLGNGINSSKEILLGENRNTNIKVNDVNYTAYSIYVAGKDNDSSLPAYLVVLCYSDINDQSSKSVYVVFPLTQTNSENLSDVDNIIQGKNDTKFELNKYIKDADGCFITNLTESHITITLAKSQISIKPIAGKDFYPQSNLSEMNINRGNNTNAVLKKQDMDWIMTCDLLTEDGPTEKQTVDPSSTATTITMFVMTILIALFSYSAAPIIYTEFGLFNLAQNVLGGNHYSINVYWFFALILLSFLSLVQGIITNKSILLFMSLSFILSYFAATRGVLKLTSVHNGKGDGFNSTSEPFAVYSQIFFGKCSSIIGSVVNISVFVVLLSLFSGIISTMALKDVFAFVTIICAFVLVSFLQLASLYYFRLKSE